jgi:hypothetical protein
MPEFIGFTVSQVDASFMANPDSVGVGRHYEIVPPPHENGPWSYNDRVAREAPAPGFCSQTSLNSTLYLELP